MNSSQRLRDDFHRDGYVVLPNAVPSHACAAALLAAERIFYGGPYEDWLRAFDAGRRAGPVPDGIAPMPAGLRSRFPVGNADLDRLIENERILDAAASILEDEPFFCAANLFARTGPTDERYPKDPDGGWHFDHFNHGLLPMSEDPESCQYLNVAVYLHDVGPDGAPTEFIPGSHRRAAAISAAAHAAGGFTTDGAFRTLAGLDVGSASSRAVAPAGTAVIYSSLLIHRPRPFRDARQRRLFWTCALGARSRAAYCRYDHPFAYDVRDMMRAVVTWTTPRVRTLLGWPPPGDPYYSPRTLELMAAMFPGIDLAPYRRASDACE